MKRFVILLCSLVAFGFPALANNFYDSLDKVVNSAGVACGGTVDLSETGIDGELATIIKRMGVEGAYDHKVVRQNLLEMLNDNVNSQTSILYEMYSDCVIRVIEAQSAAAGVRLVSTAETQCSSGYCASFKGCQSDKGRSTCSFTINFERTGELLIEDDFLIAVDNVGNLYPWENLTISDRRPIRPMRPYNRVMVASEIEMPFIFEFYNIPSNREISKLVFIDGMGQERFSFSAQ